MSISNIESATARLNALTGTTREEVTSEVNPNNPGVRAPGPNRTSLRIETGSTGPTYNKQALISSYLGRGKDAVGPTRQIGPLQDPNKQKDNSKQVLYTCQ
ncbi:hypothetical protein DFH28DRAFT_881640 [Melampsora americana]|nr:hypothetical protein DFH28DRAFT_881640 [Melampsora americana]